MSEDEALAGYRAAVAFISADSWDGCSDCIEVLKAARAADWNNEMAGNSDAVAEHLKRIRKHYTNPVEAGLTAQSAELEALRGEVAPVDAFMSERNEILRLEKYKLEATISQLRARVAALEEGVTRLERANEALCAKRTHRTYLSMIDIDRCKDELLELDLAREEARALINQNGEEG